MSSPEPPPRPDGAPKPEAEPDASRAHPGGFTLDLSSSEKPKAPESWRRRRKKADPFTTKIIDLSQQPAPKQEKPEPVKPAAKKPRKSGGAARGGSKKGAKPARPSGGSTLADLLDPETLARLRGDG